MKKSMLYSIVRPIVSILFKIVYRPKYIGLSNIPKKGKVILAGNHKNNLDCIYLMSSTKRQIHFLAKKELWKGPKKIIFSNLGLIPVDRSKKNPEAMNTALECLNNEELIGIFPEATFNRSKEVVLPFKIGAVKMAYETNSPIVPFVIKGNYKMFKKNLIIEFLEPINIIDNDLDKENERLRDIIKKKLGG